MSRCERRASPWLAASAVAAAVAIVTALVALAPATANAQIVNVQNLAGKAVKEGFTGNVGLNFNVRAGNVQFLLTGATVTTFYKFGDNVVLLTAKGDYGLKGKVGKWDDVPFRERVFEHLRYRRAFDERWGFEAFVQHEYDRWRRLNLRALVGGGPRLEVPISKDTHAAIGAAYMWQGEELLKPQAGDVQGFYVEHRLSAYITGGTKLNEHVTVAGTAYLQPNLGAINDVRGLIDGGLTVALTKKLGLKVTYVIALDSRPPETVRGYDLTGKIGFAYAL
jgi:hypothetical protein